MHIALAILCWVVGVSAYLFIGGRIAKYVPALREYFPDGVIVFLWPILLGGMLLEVVFSFITKTVTR